MAQCKALLVQCMDFRFMKGIREFLDQQELTGNCDLVSIAGVAKNIIDPAHPAEAEFALKQIGLAHDLHHIEHLVFMNHLDCGAYGGSKAFASPEEERARHIADLTKTRELVKQKYPRLDVKLVLAGLNEDSNVSFEEVA